MDEKWKIELYENARGEKLVEEFFDSLEAKVRLKINRAIELLETFGLEGGYLLCFNDWKDISYSPWF